MFARGLRNPYDLVFGSNGDLFCTDNDANNRSTGDKINRVVEGAHFGFHYTAVPDLEIDGIEQSILTCSSAQGIAFAGQAGLAGKYKDSLFVASYGDDRINRVVLDRDGGGVLEFFANIPSVVDLVITDEGTIYACSHHDPALYRIRAKGSR